MTNGTDDVQHRGFFKRAAGGIDFQRLIEQLIPMALVGAVVIYANSLVTQSQVGDLRAAQTRIESKVEKTDDKVNLQNGQLIELNAKVVTYLATQTQLNLSMDTRMTFLERDRAGKR